MMMIFTNKILSPKDIEALFSEVNQRRKDYNYHLIQSAKKRMIHLYLLKNANIFWKDSSDIDYESEFESNIEATQFIHSGFGFTEFDSINLDDMKSKLNLSSSDNNTFDNFLNYHQRESQKLKKELIDDYFECLSLYKEYLIIDVYEHILEDGVKIPFNLESIEKYIADYFWDISTNKELLSEKYREYLLYNFNKGIEKITDIRSYFWFDQSDIKNIEKELLSLMAVEFHLQGQKLVVSEVKLRQIFQKHSEYEFNSFIESIKIDGKFVIERFQLEQSNTYNIIYFDPIKFNPFNLLTNINRRRLFCDFNWYLPDNSWEKAYFALNEFLVRNIIMTDIIEIGYSAYTTPELMNMLNLQKSTINKILAELKEMDFNIQKIVDNRPQQIITQKQ